MGIDLSKFKVIYNNMVLRALRLENVLFEENNYPETGKIVHPTELEVVAFDENCAVVVIRDMADKFQFVPVIGGQA